MFYIEFIRYAFNWALSSSARYRAKIFAFHYDKTLNCTKFTVICIMYAFLTRQVFKNVGSVPHSFPSTFTTVKIKSVALESVAFSNLSHYIEHRLHHGARRSYCKNFELNILYHWTNAIDKSHVQFGSSSTDRKTLANFF